jgi:hypothetical protein
MLYVPCGTVEGRVKLSLIAVGEPDGRNNLGLNEDVPDHTTALVELLSSNVTFQFL